MGFSAHTCIRCPRHQGIQGETHDPGSVLKIFCLVESHDYNNIIFIISRLFSQGKRFLQLKNPWSHLRWKGRYSERDEKNWTPDLLKYLNFDPKTAQKFDNGKSVLN